LGAGGGEGGCRGGGDGGGAHLGEDGGLGSRCVGEWDVLLPVKKVLSIIYRLRAYNFGMVDSAGVWSAMDWYWLSSRKVFLIITSSD
jgi:hypothetical protein